MVGYGVVIFFVLILGLFTACQFPFGIVLLSVLLLVGAAVWLVVALVTMGAMVVLQDGCAGAERIILDQVCTHTHMHTHTHTCSASLTHTQTQKTKQGRALTCAGGPQGPCTGPIWLAIIQVVLCSNVCVVL